jgi:hypothetical protein
MVGTDFAVYVKELVASLRAEGKTVWFVPLDARQRYPQFSVMPKIVLEGGEIHELSYIRDGNGQRPRYVAVMRVEGSEAEVEVVVVPELESEAGLEGYHRAQIAEKRSLEEVIDATLIGRLLGSMATTI